MRGELLRDLRRLSGESGQTLVIAALGLIAIVGFIALAVDVGYLRYAKRQLQSAADAAALAGALEIIQCNGAVACSAMKTAAQDALTENGLTGSTVVTNCATSVVTGLKLMVNNGPCSLGPQDPNSGDPNYVEVLLTQSEPTYFAKVLGYSSTMLTVRSEAARSDGGMCIYALDPTGSNAFVVNSGVTLTSTCGLMVESNSSTASVCTSSSVSVSFIGLVGGFTDNGCSVSGTYKLNMNVPTPADPLSGMAEPTVPSCGTSTKSPYHGSASSLVINGTATLYSDYAYCGGITINNGATVTFQPGTYVLTSTNGGATKAPGGLTLQIGANITGSGVTFYNYGPSGAISMTYASSSGSINLTAPTSGTYSGVLFFQYPGNTTGANITGAQIWGTVLQGTYYFPKAAVNYSFSGNVQYNLLVAYDIAFSVASSSQGVTQATIGNNNNYVTLANAGPPTGKAAVLVQ